MDKQYFGLLIVYLVLLFKFLIFPVLTSFIVFIKILTMKKTIKKAGIIYYSSDNKKRNNYPELFLLVAIVFTGLMIFFILLKEWFVSIIVFSFLFYYISEYISNKKFKNIYGIYENGIINYDKVLIEWKEIHSYEINENNVSGYFKDGALFEYKNMVNIDEINNLFEKNGIVKRTKVSDTMNRRGE
jgi:hypothetical protein